jgi:hypothetical protein
MAQATDQDLAMVNIDTDEIIVRDYSRAAQVLVTIGLRILDEEKKGCDDEPDLGLRASVN